MRKPAFCVCEKIDVDQLRGQHLCFRYIDSTISLNLKFQASSHFCGCLARFVSDQSCADPENFLGMGGGGGGPT